jgi:hypothetical protein
VDQPGFNAMQTFQTDATIVVDALPKVLQGSWEYGTRGYWRTTQNRVAVIGDLLRAGVTMLLVEPDATWIRNVYDQDDLVGNMNNDILGMSDDGKYSKRRRSNVAVIHVRIVFIGAFLFCCLLLNHSFQTNPNMITNCFKLILSIYNFTTTLLLRRYFDF